MAMLAKQVWCFHTEPTSLISRCFKAKYYPNSDVLHATTGNNPSYSWRSIQNSIWVITKGSCWRIGDGNSVDIWKDSWIPSYKDFKVMSKRQDNQAVTKVKDLINFNECCWDNESLEGQFLNIDKDKIQQIPLVNTSIPDMLMWMQEPNGLYSVKSGYRAIKQWQTNNNHHPSTSYADNPIWKKKKKIWSLHTIPRHKTLLWRILHNSLPVRSEFSKRGIHCYNLCPRCHSKMETLTHIFLTCPNSCKVWFGSSLSLNFSNIPNPDFREWLYDTILN